MKSKLIARSLYACITACLFFTGHKIHAQQEITPQSAIGFIVKYNDPKAEATALELARFVLSEKAQVIFAHDNKTVAEKLAQSEQKEHKNNIHVIAKDQLPENIRAIVVLGGDGTILSTARLMTKKSVPILGINFGYLGFLAEIDPTAARSLLHTIIRGEMPPIRECLMCRATLTRNNAVVFSGIAANDVVITRSTPHVVTLEVSVDNQKAYSLSGDGIVVATPIGSTAYSLSAGGPIVMPNMSAFIITPLCPHGLTLRPIVVPGTAHVEIKIIRITDRAYVTFDGHGEIDLQKGDTIRIERADTRSFKIVTSPKNNYFGVLKEKLHFGAGS